MNDIEIKLLNAKLYLNYYKNNNILDRYATIIEGLVIDNDCLSVLKNPNEKLYITPLSKNVNKEEKYKDLEQIEQEHKEENGRLREENINLKEKIVRQQEQLNIANKKILAQKGQLKVVNNSYIPISKLKEKIEELNKEEKKSLKGTKGQDRYSIKLEYMHKRNALQELLEENEK